MAHGSMIAAHEHDWVLVSEPGFFRFGPISLEILFVGCYQENTHESQICDQESRCRSGYLLVNLDFLGFGPFPWKYNSFTRNEAQEQHSLLDTIFDYIFYFGPPGKYLYLSPQNPLHVGQRSRPTCSRFS